MPRLRNVSHVSEGRGLERRAKAPPLGSVIWTTFKRRYTEDVERLKAWRRTSSLMSANATVLAGTTLLSCAAGLLIAHFAA
jgi:hypothetical protein